MYLKRYSSAGNGKNDQGEYYRRTLQVILEEDRRIRLPKWLLDWFMVSEFVAQSNRVGNGRQGQSRKVTTDGLSYSLPLVHTI